LRLPCWQRNRWDWTFWAFQPLEVCVILVAADGDGVYFVFACQFLFAIFLGHIVLSLGALPFSLFVEESFAFQFPAQTGHHP
jgi:hypothetical protein